MPRTARGAVDVLAPSHELPPLLLQARCPQSTERAAPVTIAGAAVRLARAAGASMFLSERRRARPPSSAALGRARRCARQPRLPVNGGCEPPRAADVARARQQRTSALTPPSGSAPRCASGPGDHLLVLRRGRAFGVARKRRTAGAATRARRAVPRRARRRGCEPPVTRPPAPRRSHWQASSVRRGASPALAPPSGDRLSGATSTDSSSSTCARL